MGKAKEAVVVAGALAFVWLAIELAFKPFLSQTRDSIDKSDRPGILTMLLLLLLLKLTPEMPTKTTDDLSAVVTIPFLHSVFR
nr:outer envelope membrane 14K protein, chloroplast - garden pea [Pisum sativum]